MKRVYGVTKKQLENRASKLLDEYKKTGSYKDDLNKFRREFVEYVIYGKSSISIFEEIEAMSTDTYNMTKEEILRNFHDLLSVEEIEKLKNL